jgi:hypothetical protein
MRYSRSRDGYILRGIGATTGPVLREDRRSGGTFDGVDRRHARASRGSQLTAR